MYVMFLKYITSDKTYVNIGNPHDSALIAYACDDDLISIMILIKHIIYFL